MEHELKIKQEYYYDILRDLKSFEVRKNDRNFQTGDKLTFKVIDDNGNTGDIFWATVGYILKEFEGLAEGYIVFSLEDIRFYWE